MTYLNIVAMQNNPGVILDVNGVIDTNVDDKKPSWFSGRTA